MKSIKFFLVALLGLWISAGCERTVAPYIAIGGVAPDLMLVATGCLSLFTHRRGGTLVGFSSGLFQGAVAGANLAAYTISRTLGGFLGGSFNSMGFERSAVLAGVVVAITTLLAQIMLMFIAPTSGIGAFLLATIGMAVYNGVLAMPLYATLRRVFDPPAR